MAISQPFKDYVLEQLMMLGDITVQKMFGVVGLYCEGYIFSLISDDVLYFKLDHSNRNDYQKAGMEPLKPFATKKSRFLIMKCLLKCWKTESAS